LRIKEVAEGNLGKAFYPLLYAVGRFLSLAKSPPFYLNFEKYSSISGLNSIPTRW